MSIQKPVYVRRCVTLALARKRDVEFASSTAAPQFLNLQRTSVVLHANGALVLHAGAASVVGPVHYEKELVQEATSTGVGRRAKYRATERTIAPSGLPAVFCPNRHMANRKMCPSIIMPLMSLSQNPLQVEGSPPLTSAGTHYSRPVLHSESLLPSRSKRGTELATTAGP